MACTGMTWDAVLDDLDLIRLQALTNYWNNHPPLHLMVANYLGFKPKPSPINTQQEANAEQIETLTNIFPTAPKPIYMDMDEYKRRRQEQLGASHE